MLVCKIRFNFGSIVIIGIGANGVAWLFRSLARFARSLAQCGLVVVVVVAAPSFRLLARTGHPNMLEHTRPCLRTSDYA